MRKQQLTISLGKDLVGLLSASAKRRNRSISNYAGLLLEEALHDEAAAVRANQVEQPPSAAAA
jgi:hypothetical protein